MSELLKKRQSVKVRNSNFELMRIIMMILIVAHHLVVNSGISDFYDFNNVTANMIFLQLFGMFGKTAINCFTLITGYFMVKSNITIQKFLKLYLEVKFYKFVIYAVFLLTGYEQFSFGGLFKTIFSVAYGANVGYTGTFVVMFLFIPILNILVHAMNKCQYQYLLLLIFVYFTVFSTFIMNDTFDFTAWLICVYFIGGYIRLYSNKWFESAKIAAIMTAVSIVLMSASVIVVNFIGSRFGFESYYHMISNSNKLLAVMCSVSVFLLFKNMDIKQSRFINTIAASAFGVLQIHAGSDAMRKFLWNDLLKIDQLYNSKYLIVYAVIYVIAIYIVCTFIDYLRIALLEKPLFKTLNILINNKSDRILNLWETNISK